jgi:hypothetical protein
MRPWARLRMRPWARLRMRPWARLRMRPWARLRMAQPTRRQCARPARRISPAACSSARHHPMSCRTRRLLPHAASAARPPHHFARGPTEHAAAAVVRRVLPTRSLPGCARARAGVWRRLQQRLAPMIALAAAVSPLLRSDCQLTAAAPSTAWLEPAQAQTPLPRLGRPAGSQRLQGCRPRKRCTTRCCRRRARSLQHPAVVAALPPRRAGRGERHWPVRFDRRLGNREQATCARAGAGGGKGTRDGRARRSG